MNKLNNLLQQKAELEKQIFLVQLEKLRKEERQLSFDKEEAEFEEYLKTTPEFMHKALRVCWGEFSWDLDEVIKFVDLNEHKKDAKYLINTYWSNDGNNELVTEEKLIETIYEKIRSYYDEGFSISIYDLFSGEAIDILDLIEIKIKG